MLAKGRLIIGAGAGWMKEEFELLGVPFEDQWPADGRVPGRLKELWTKDKPAYSGKYVRFSDVLFYPKPVQKPHPPLWIGGESAPALRRTIKFADVWYPGSNSQTKPLDTPERLAAGIADLKRTCAAAGRAPPAWGSRCSCRGSFDGATTRRRTAQRVVSYGHLRRHGSRRRRSVVTRRGPRGAPPRWRRGPRSVLPGSTASEPR